MWGELWAALGYVAILVDGFGPRGYPRGFPQHSYDERPEAVNEVTVRPLDAYGALKYLRTRSDVIADRIGLQGWSNGGSATLAAMAEVAADTPGAVMRGPRLGFRAALALYPACGLKGIFDDGYLPYAPVRVLQGDADEEVSAKRCAAFVEKSRAHGGDIDIVLYPGATHDFDDPGARRQGLNANVAAKADALMRARAFFDAAGARRAAEVVRFKQTFRRVFKQALGVNDNGMDHCAPLSLERRSYPDGKSSRIHVCFSE